MGNAESHHQKEAEELRRMPICASSSRSSVQMIEFITSSHTVDGKGLVDIQHLLKLMDICTCACSEKHTGVKCLTVSMGDVVFEYFPRIGEMLELTARPVYSGRTSLDIALTVISEGDEGVRRIVCEAVFTYVTTRGPNGQKRFSPPLPKIDNEQTEWEATIAEHRRTLVKMERDRIISSLEMMVDGDNSHHLYNEETGFDFEMTEVVLPAHQNHIGSTFGGVVMAWMAKAALIEAARKSRCLPSSLLIRSVHRVDFKVGSAVSDHLLFRPRLNAIFDEGLSVEVEVRVNKRSISTGNETSMNVGYFYISGPTLLPLVNTPPFEPTMVSQRRSASLKVQQATQVDAAWRRRLLLARRQLLGGLSDVVEWHPALDQEAPLLTMKSVLRLVHHHDPRVRWNALAPQFDNSGETVMEWSPGEAWGRRGTFVIRVKRLFRNESLSVAAVLHTLKTKRILWDMTCKGIKAVESSKEKVGMNEKPKLQWEIVEHKALVPTLFRRSASASGVQQPEAIVHFCYLRTSKVNEEDDNAILASQSVLHPAVEATAKVQPSGWFMRKVEGQGVELTYIAEHDLTRIREVASGMPDSNIIGAMGALAESWVAKLASIDHDTR